MPNQPKSKHFPWRNAAIGVTALALLPVGIWGIGKFLRLEPFASNRQPDRATTAMELHDVDIRHYSGAKLTTQAHADRVQLSTDRQQFELFDVTSGVYSSDKGTMDFAAKEAVWNQPLKTLYVRKGANLKNKDMDLQTPEARFTQADHVLQAKKEIRGKLYDGEVQAVQFRYNVDSGNFVVGKTSWKGLLAMKVQDGQVTQTPTRWELEGDDVRSTTKDIVLYENGTASDGDIILKAPKVEHNRKTDVVTGTGGVLYYSPEANLVADKVVVYRKEKRAVLTGHVRMLVKPEDQQDQPAKIEPIPEFKLLEADKVNVKPAGVPQTPEEKKAVEELRSSDSMKKYPTQLASDQIEYWYGKGNRKANINGSPQAHQDFSSGFWRHIWADHAVYDGEAETITLLSSDKAKARTKNSYGDDMIADSFTASTKKDDETFSGKHMKGVAYSASDDDETGRTKKDKVSTDQKKGGGS